jgi:putative transposase
VTGKSGSGVWSEQKERTKNRNFAYYATFFLCVVLFLFPITMRLARLKSQGRGFYHCISRVVDGQFIFGTRGGSGYASEKFLSLMRRLSAFSGVNVLTFIVMSNHFHLLCEVPELRELSLEEVLKRVEAGYGPAKVQELRNELARCGEGTEHWKRVLAPYRRRMNDVSVFIKELKGRFAQWYNRRKGRYGALWAERFKSVLLEDGQAVAAVAAYIDLNAVRAALCVDPKDYRYCGYAEALSKGCASALEGIRTILGLGRDTPRKELLREYRKHLFDREALGRGTESPAGPRTVQVQDAQKAIDGQPTELSPLAQLRCRIRYFSDGVILGSRTFVEEHCKHLREKIGYQRKSGPTAIKGLGPIALWSFRGLRVRKFG